MQKRLESDGEQDCHKGDGTSQSSPLNPNFVLHFQLKEIGSLARTRDQARLTHRNLGSSWKFSVRPYWAACVLLSKQGLHDGMRSLLLGYEGSAQLLPENTAQKPGHARMSWLDCQLEALCANKDLYKVNYYVKKISTG